MVWNASFASSRKASFEVSFDAGMSLIILNISNPKNWKKIRTNDDDLSYVGEVKGGVPNGEGTMTWSDGEKYVGEFKDGVPHGQGTYTWLDVRL